jgi:hypothetical protein
MTSKVIVMKATILVLAIVLVAPQAALGSELSVRGSIGSGFTLEGDDGQYGTSPGAGTAGMFYWSPRNSGTLRPIMGGGYWRSTTRISCPFECGHFQVATNAVPLVAGVRIHLGAQDRRHRSIYFEVCPGILYLRQTIDYQRGVFDVEPAHGREEHWLFAGLATVAVPIALSSTLSLELGASYLWSEGLDKPTGAQFFSSNLHGLDELSFVLGLAVR